MLASRLPGILPPLEEDDALQVAAVRSVARRRIDGHWRRRPFRSPHHTSSAIALVGGGSHPRPGEISLAHQGVLFLDELPEFPRSVLEVLREPLESGQISISRANAQVEYPARFQLVAAMNPCPCGYYGDKSGRCRCTPFQVERYRNKISGPLLDRFDMHIQVETMPVDELQRRPRGETSIKVRERVARCRSQQLDRQGKANALLAGEELHAHCQLTPAQQTLMASAMDRLQLSARAYDRTLRVARTLADMAGSKAIDAAHLSEALGYRHLDRAL